MKPRNVAGPETTFGKVARSRDLVAARFEVPPNTPSPHVEQDVLAHLLIAPKFGLRPDRARLICFLANIGNREAA
jgi:hypothetical protein